MIWIGSRSNNKDRTRLNQMNQMNLFSSFGGLSTIDIQSDKNGGNFNRLGLPKINSYNRNCNPNHKIFMTITHLWLFLIRVLYLILWHSMYFSLLDIRTRFCIYSWSYWFDRAFVYSPQTRQKTQNSLSSFFQLKKQENISSINK